MILQIEIEESLVPIIIYLFRDGKTIGPSCDSNIDSKMSCEVSR